MKRKKGSKFNPKKLIPKKSSYVITALLALPIVTSEHMDIILIAAALLGVIACIGFKLLESKPKKPEDGKESIKYIMSLIIVGGSVVLMLSLVTYLMVCFL